MVILNENLEYDTTATILSEATGRALGAVMAKTRHLLELGFETFEKLFCSRVVPILGYFSEIWGFKDFQSSDSIQERAIRVIVHGSGVHRFTAIPALRGEVGWSKTRSDRWLSMICYWNRLVCMSASRLTHKMFEWDYKLSEGNVNWSPEICTIMNAYGFEDKFISKFQCNLETVNSRIKNKDIESWHSDVRKKIKLRTYVTFKNEFNVEPYLLNHIQKCQCSVFAKLRCGILPLHFETGAMHEYGTRKSPM